MRAVPAAVFLVGLMLLAEPGRSEITETELQRCVWSCLAGTSGPDSAEYNACIADRCSADGETDAGSTSTPWRSGRLSDGTLYAQVDLGRRGSEAGLYYFCRRGIGYLLISDPRGEGGLVHFVIDGLFFPIEFSPHVRGRSEADLVPDDPLIAALGRGSRLEIFDPRGHRLYAPGLDGSATALGEVVEGCGEVDRPGEGSD